MAKVVKTLRTHWKKSTFAAILGYYGLDYAYDRHKTFLLMRDYSQQALAHGRRKLPDGAKNKHITLLLNPTAGNRKSKARLEKYAEPLLHLSGFLVNIVKTERIDEARDLAGIIERTNVIAVAGGDGTVFETITGLLRREDAEEAVLRYPVGIIPVGTENQFGKQLLKSFRNDPEPKFIAEAAMAIVNHRMRPADVMEIKIADTDKQDEGEEPKAPRKPFYSLVGVNLGQYREAKKIKEEMPSFFGQLFTSFWSLLRVQPLIVKAQLNYIPTCSGCAKCKKEEEEKLEQSRAKAAAEKKQTEETKYPQSSIWSRITSIFSRSPVLADSDVLVENPDCGVQKSICIESSELNVMVAGGGKLKVEIGGRLGRTDFMIEGLRRHRGESPNYKMTLECKEIEICPVEGGPEYFSIDNEEFEVKRVKLKAIKDRVYFFVP
ncbi:Acylglycerol kinase, mitochondrial [Orchesella cincta]|uniref:Acylglycerol kinase, mitochondrial n=1 Tax=Orchesella cincta TaxID=48709 RepID=A0A1D2N563_ORCCI|nr:Acylglycerol kinase, mitochondrial [Orchesella cincta]